ncbi:MAG: MbnP family protein [Rhizobiaceae bacterium]
MWLRLSTGCLAAAILGIGAWLAYQHFYPPSNSLRLVFHAEIDGKPLEPNVYAHDNPGGDGQFQVRNFRFYLSNFELVGSSPNDPVQIEDGYYLARFDNAQASYIIDFAGLPLRELHSLSFAIGVDADANTSIAFRGDLDPNSQMAWNWKVGYKFVVLEGNLKRGNTAIPLVYHVGFSENLRQVNYSWQEPLQLGSNSQVDFSVDAMKLFNGRSIIDMAQLNSVKFDKEDARTLADNYSKMITLKP